MVLTDNQLGMIEQLTYLNSSVASEAGISGFTSINAGQKNMTISKILNCFDEKALATLESKGDTSIGYVSAKEWAGIIRYLKSSEMKDLVLTDTMKDSEGTTLALCFSEDNNSNEAIVAFRGTTKGEWGDNIEGLNVADTPCQLEAREYIKSLPYDNITVTGHSKGANKAMYVAVTSDKVTRCVAYDGQGVSQEFIDKYGSEIINKADTITAYSVSTDYVHALLFPIPGSKQVYCQGFGIANTGEHHSPNSFFMTDENGNIVVDDKGNPTIIETDEDESIKMLHEFTTFVLNNASDEEKEKITGYLCPLIAKVFSGEKLDVQEMINDCLADTDTLALIIAYLVKYMDVQNLSAEDVDKLLTTIGLSNLDDLFTLKVGDFSIVGLSGLIDFAKGQLTDNDDDKIITFILSKIEIDGLDIDSFWRKIDSNVKNIDASKGCGDAKVIGAFDGFIANAYVTMHPYIRVNTAALRGYADRLVKVNRRLCALDRKMDSLYLKVGLRDLFNLLQVDLLAGSSGRISNCAKYLEETANDFDHTERNVVEQF